MRSALLRLAWTILMLLLTFYIAVGYVATLRDLGVARAERDEARNLLVTLREQGAAQLGARMTRMETAFADLSASIDRRFVIPLPLPEPELIGKPVSPQPPTTRPSVLLIESPLTRAITLPEPELIEEE